MSSSLIRIDRFKWALFEKCAKVTLNVDENVRGLLVAYARSQYAIFMFNLMTRLFEYNSSSCVSARFSIRCSHNAKKYIAILPLHSTTLNIKHVSLVYMQPVSIICSLFWRYKSHIVFINSISKWPRRKATIAEFWTEMDNYAAEKWYVRRTWILESVVETVRGKPRLIRISLKEIISIGCKLQLQRKPKPSNFISLLFDFTDKYRCFFFCWYTHQAHRFRNENKLYARWCCRSWLLFKTRKK